MIKATNIWECAVGEQEDYNSYKYMGMCTKGTKRQTLIAINRWKCAVRKYNSYK